MSWIWNESLSLYRFLLTHWSSMSFSTEVIKGQALQGQQCDVARCVNACTGRLGWEQKHQNIHITCLPCWKFSSLGWAVMHIIILTAVFQMKWLKRYKHRTRMAFWIVREIQLLLKNNKTTFQKRFLHQSAAFTSTWFQIAGQKWIFKKNDN